MPDAAMPVAVPDEFAQHGRWRAFREPSVEASYREWHRNEILPVARVVGALSAVAWGANPLWFRAFVDDLPTVLLVVAYGVAVPTILIALLVSYSPLARWAIPALTFANIVIGLCFIVVFAGAFGRYSGMVTAGALSAVFYPLIFRLPTVATAIVTVVVSVTPSALLLNGFLRSGLSANASLPYVSMLLTAVPISIFAAAQIEAGMRKQFAAQRIIVRQQSELQAGQRLLRRYVPEQVADAVLSATPEAMDRHERRKLTIFFSDLVGFTDLSDEMEPEDLATVLNDYFTEMSAIARKHGGTVDDLIGDAVLVLFGAPEFTDDHDQALRAVRMAAEMQEAMGPLNTRWASAGIPATLAVRMGINTGVATVGNFGSAERTKYTALGKQVNVAARIQSHCAPGKVLIGHTTWLLVHDEIACIPTGELELKGLRKPMPAYEVHD